MVLDHLLLSIQPQSILEWTCTSFEQFLSEFYTILLEEHLQVALVISEVVICSNTCPLPCSNSALKVNNGTSRILYHNIPDKTNPPPPPPPLNVSLLEPGISDCRLPCVFFKEKSSWCREQHEGQLIWQYHTCFNLTDFKVLWSWHGCLFTHLSITFSNQRFSNCSHTACVDVRFVKLTLGHFSGNRIFKMNTRFGN
jgi:hypothetical protein